jgi:hypothetical protein
MENRRSTTATDKQRPFPRSRWYRKTLDRLTALRGPGESYSDVILKLAKTAP